MWQQKMIRRKKNVKKGIQFCLMVCGASGTGMYSNPSSQPLYLVLPRPSCFTSVGPNTDPSSTGRTTFVNTLCGKGVLSHKDSEDPNGAHVEDGVKIKPITVGA
jgi:cell division control protein 11